MVDSAQKSLFGSAHGPLRLYTNGAILYRIVSGFVGGIMSYN